MAHNGSGAETVPEGVGVEEFDVISRSNRGGGVTNELMRGKLKLLEVHRAGLRH
jgi:hypothetical protein